MKNQVVLLFIFAALSARADVFSTYGDVEVVTPGPNGEPSAWKITSDAVNVITPLGPNTSGMGYGGLEVKITGVLTPNMLYDLSANYEWLAGVFGVNSPLTTPGGGGSPRFTLFDSGQNAAYLYWGENITTVADPNDGAWGSTGNLTDPAGTNMYVTTAGFGGDSQNFMTWAQFLSVHGYENISIIRLDLDNLNGGGATQQMLTNNFRINDVTYDAPVPAVPEPTSIVLFGTLIGCIALVLRRENAA